MVVNGTFRVWENSDQVILLEVWDNEFGAIGIKKFLSHLTNSLPFPKLKLKT